MIGGLLLIAGFILGWFALDIYAWVVFRLRGMRRIDTSGWMWTGSPCRDCGAVYQKDGKCVGFFCRLNGTRATDPQGLVPPV